MKKLLFFLLSSLSLFSYEVLSFGNAIIDYIVFVDEEAIEGGMGGSFHVPLEHFESIIGENPIKLPGGSAPNTMKSLASFGYSCAIIGRIGNDEDGIHYRETLKSRGVDPLFTEYETGTGRVVCMITPDGKRTMRSYLGDFSDFAPFPYDESAYEGAQIFHIEGYQIRNLDLLKSMTQKAKAAGALISLDLGCHELVKDFHTYHDELIDHHIDLLFCNGDEARELTGLEPKEACHSLSKRCTTAVVTMGADGGYVASGGEIFHYPAIKAPQVDDTGAGDNFIAGFFHGLLSGYDLEECAHEGAKLASQVVQVIGTDLLASQGDTE